METEKTKINTGSWTRCLLLAPAALSAVLGVLSAFLSGRALELSDLLPFLFCLITVAVSVLYFLKANDPTFPAKKIQAFMPLLTPILCFAALEGFTHSPLTIRPAVMLLNLAFFVILELILCFATKKISLSCDVLMILTALLGIANNLAVQGRNIPIYPWDIASLGVALSVAGNYTFYLTPAMAACLSLLSLGLLLASVGHAEVVFSHLWKRFVALALSVCALFGYVFYLSTDRVWTDFALDPYTFDARGVYEKNGFSVSFLAFLKQVFISEPQDYNRASLEEAMEPYVEASVNEAADKAAAVKPNIIILMDEAFSDLSVLIDQKDWTSEDPLPFLHSLSDTSLSGYASVSVLGGNTPNSEFEILTGLSMAFLPTGTVPYQQYITEPMDSLVSQLSSLGYHTTALHPYLSTGWKRDVIYPRFGFDESLFWEDFQDIQTHSKRIRAFISDDALVNKLIDTYQQNKKLGEPQFIFAVSMQNHGGYTDGADYTNFRQNVFAKGLEGDTELATYLSLMKLSDTAIKKLVNYFSNSDEPTVILVFGDHQPNESVVDGLLSAYGGDDSSSAEAAAKRYKVPFVLWTNYDTDTAGHSLDTSLNFLNEQLISVAGLPRTPFQLYLSKLQTEISSLSAAGIRLSNGEYYADVQSLPEDLVTLYSQLQYNDLFDRKNLLSSVFVLP